MTALNPFQPSQLLPVSIQLGFMGTFSSTIVCQSHSINPVISKIRKTHDFKLLGNRFRPMNTSFGTRRLQFIPPLVSTTVEETAKTESSEGKPRFKWVEVDRHVTDAQKQAISQLSPKMEKRCKALMRQLICFNPSKGSLCELLAAWVWLMKPRRADWLAVLKELKIRDHPLYLEVRFCFYFLFFLSIWCECNIICYCVICLVGPGLLGSKMCLVLCYFNCLSWLLNINNVKII